MTHELKLKVGSPHVLRDHIAEAIVGYSQGSNIRHTLEDLLAQVAEQLPSHTDEPEGFGSVVRARCPEDPDDVAAELWSPSPFHGKHYWQSEAGLVEVWSELTDVEVLRVGLGSDPLAEWETDLLNQQARRDVAAAVLSAMDVDQYLIDAVANARPR